MSWNRFRKVALSAFFLIVVAVSPLSAGGGTSSGDFLNIPMFSRGAALGGSWVAVAEGAGALFYNPAGIGRNGVGELSLSHSELYQDLKLENISLAYPLKDGSGLGLGVTYLGYGTIDGYDLSGNATGDISAYSLMVSLGYSRKISDPISAGLVVKPIFEQLGGHSAQAVSFDLGLIADLGQFSFGAQLANWGASLKYVEERIGLPVTIRAGAAYRTLGANSTISVVGSRKSNGLYSLGTGMEYQYSHNLCFRVGYGSTLESERNASDGFSLGVGLRLEPVNIDYSYRPSWAIDGIHQITGSYRFGR